MADQRNEAIVRGALKERLGCLRTWTGDLSLSPQSLKVIMVEGGGGESSLWKGRPRVLAIGQKRLQIYFQFSFPLDLFHAGRTGRRLEQRKEKGRCPLGKTNLVRQDREGQRRVTSGSTENGDRRETETLVTSTTKEKSGV